MAEKIVRLPYAGPETMGNSWGIEEKPKGARIKNHNGQWKPYFNPNGESGKRSRKENRNETYN